MIYHFLPFLHPLSIQISFSAILAVCMCGRFSLQTALSVPLLTTYLLFIYWSLFDINGNKLYMMYTIMLIHIIGLVADESII